jgi:transposase
MHIEPASARPPISSRRLCGPRSAWCSFPLPTSTSSERPNPAKKQFRRNPNERSAYDTAKRIKGRNLLVDTLGLVLGAAVTPASTPERDGAQTVLSKVVGWFTRLRLLWVDGGYTGDTFAQWVKELRPKLAVEVVKLSDATSGFKVLPHRWVVERTFGWLIRFVSVA